MNADISYYSTNNYVATVDQSGVVQTVSDGVATIITKNTNDVFVKTSTNVTVGDQDNLPSARFQDSAKELIVYTGSTIDLKDY